MDLETLRLILLCQEGLFDSVCSTDMPDGNLDYEDAIDSTMKVFHFLYRFSVYQVHCGEIHV